MRDFLKGITFLTIMGIVALGMFFALAALLLKIVWMIFVTGPFNIQPLTYWQAVGIWCLSAVFVLPWMGLISGWRKAIQDYLSQNNEQL